VAEVADAWKDDFLDEMGRVRIKGSGGIKEKVIGPAMTACDTRTTSN
jgi:hypothetical protein